jgi:hypothetical protein
LPRYNYSPPRQGCTAPQSCSPVPFNSHINFFCVSSYEYS